MNAKAISGLILGLVMLLPMPMQAQSAPPATSSSGLCVPHFRIGNDGFYTWKLHLAIINRKDTPTPINYYRISDPQGRDLRLRARELGTSNGTYVDRFLSVSNTDRIESIPSNGARYYVVYGNSSSWTDGYIAFTTPSTWVAAEGGYVPDLDIQATIRVYSYAGELVSSVPVPAVVTYQREREFIFHAFSTPGETVGIAVASPWDLTAAKVIFTLFDNDGRKLGESAPIILKRGERDQIALLFADYFQSWSDRLQAGTIKVAVTQSGPYRPGVAVMGLRVDYAPGRVVFSSLPLVATR